MSATLPQFVYCWSAHGLFGTGYGVRAASPELLSLGRDDWTRYFAYCDYVPAEQRQHQEYASTAPLCLARYRLPDRGHLLVRKTPSGRPGTYFVHAMIDADGLVDPMLVTHAADAPFWLETEETLDGPECPLPSLPASEWLALGAPPGAEPALTEEAAGDLARYAAARVEGRLAYLPDVGASALPRIRSLLTLLPVSVAVDLCFSTYQARELPGAVDVVGDSAAGRAPAPAEWMSRLVALARNDPQRAAALRADQRAQSLEALAAVVDALTAPLTSAAVVEAATRESPFVREMLRRPGAAEALVGAIDAEPRLWAGERVRTLEPEVIAALGGAASLLRLAAERIDDRREAATTFGAAYRAAQADLGRRLHDLSAATQELGPDATTELALMLLADHRDVEPDVAERWEPLITPSWTRLADVLSSAPRELRAGILRSAMVRGEPDGPPKLPDGAAAYVVSAVADVAGRPGSEARAAAFLLGFALGRRDEDVILSHALERPLPPGFVRGPLADRLLDLGHQPSETIRAALVAAGTSDCESFRRLLETPEQQPATPPTRRRSSAGLFRRRR